MSKRRAIHDHYEHRARQADRLAAHDVVDWGDPQAQLKRFAVLADNVPLAGRSLLDVGCGLGALWEFLRQRGLDVEYTGVDIVAEMVRAAQARHPDVRFVHADIFAENPFAPGRFHVAFVSGTFNLNLGNNRDFLPTAIGRLLEIASEFAVFNLLHHRTPAKYDHCVYWEPAEVLAIAQPLCGKVTLIEDYLPNDFTVLCHK